MLCSSWSVTVFLALFVGVSKGHTGNESSAQKVNPDAVFPRSWISVLFHEALGNFTMRNVKNTECQNQNDIYESSLRNYTSWAVRMAESWDRRPIGILAGNRYHLGVYEECVSVHSPIRGQYCISEVKITSLTTKDYTFNRTEDLDSFGNNHAWHTIFGWLNYTDQVQRNIVNLGVCIPDSCLAFDLQTTLQNAFDKVFSPEHVKAVVNVDPIMCTVSGDMYSYTRSYYITSAFFVLLIMICCSATLHHFIILAYQQHKKVTTDSFFNSFSFIQSSKELLKFDKNNELNLFNGLKVLAMIFILFGHRFMYLAGNPMKYPKFVENIYLHGPDILLTSMNLVDPFFYLSGYLMYLTVSPAFLKKGSIWIKIISPIIYRIVRILPAYCAMMAITAHIVPHLGDGPLWPKKTWPEVEKCQNYWWTNLLFISNLIDVKYQCLIISWYISCDIQFFILGVVILYIYTKNTKYGITLLSVVIGISLYVPFIVTFLTERDGLLKVDIPFLENPRTSITFNESYRPSYMRAIPFFIGMAMGFVVEVLKKKKVKFSQTTVYCTTIVIIAICIWIQLYGAIFYSRQRPYYPIEQALYSTISHCVWPVIFGWICVFHFTTGYGPLKKLLDNRLTVSLGRLSYSVFLVNLVVMMMSQSSQKQVSYLSGKSLIDAWIYDTFKSYLMGFMLYLVVEAPFGNITRKLFRRGKTEHLPSNNNETSIEK